MTKSKTKAKAKTHKPAAKKKNVKTTAKKKPAVKAKTVAAPKKVVKPVAHAAKASVIATERRMRGALDGGTSHSTPYQYTLSRPAPHVFRDAKAIRRASALACPNTIGTSGDACATS